MMRWVLGVLFAAFLLPAPPASADECEGRGGVIEQIECVEELLAREDARLNRVWKRVMADHPSGGDPDVHRDEIRAAQRLWIRFRDADCEARSKTGIPKYWALNRLTCQFDMTRARTETLTEVYLF